MQTDLKISHSISVRNFFMKTEKFFPFDYVVFEKFEKGDFVIFGLVFYIHS